MRVCLDARLISGTAGGVESVVIGLAYGLSRLADGDEEYLFLAYRDADEWIRPYVSGPCHMLYGPKTPQQSAWARTLKTKTPRIHQLWRRLSPVSERWKIGMLWSDGTIERAGVDIMHFTHQVGFRTRVPSIYHPHDLQHLHFPQFYSLGRRLVREIVYRRFCRQARMVAAQTSWLKRDLIRHYGLPEAKVQVVPFAPVSVSYPNPSEKDMEAVRQKYALPQAFIFYPAQTWTHKNHLGLLEALAILRDRYGTTVPFVSSGRLYRPFFPKIETRINELGLNGQVQFLGFVNPLELQCLYKLCRSVIIPTKFETVSGPLWEAFLSGTPAACSNVTSLPEQAGDAALIFDPDRPAEIAGAIHRLWTDETLRQILVRRGHTKLGHFSWERTARLFRAHYRRIAHRPLTEEDRALLAAAPLL